MKFWWQVWSRQQGVNGERGSAGSSSPGRPSHVFRVPVAIGGLCCLGASVASAGWLHTLTSRPEAGWIAALGWVWGVAAIATAATLRNTRFPLAWIWVAAIALRLPLLGTPPVLSDDVYRYLWEGLALNSGYNPFITPPTEIHGLNDSLRDLVNHGEITSIYPPVALWWFRCWAAMGWDVFGLQLGTAWVDVVTAGVLASILQRRNLPVWPAMLYALHPVAVMESAHGAHLDVLAVSGAAWAILLTHLKTPTPSWIALFLGIGLKLFPVVLLPTWIRRHGVRSSAIAGLVGSAVMLVLALPVLTEPQALLRGFSAYTGHWSFNGLLYPVLLPWLGSWTRAVLIVTGALAVGFAAWKYRDPVSVWLTAGAAFLMLSPTVHPWYALWALVPSLLAGRWGWSIASISLFGSYAVLWTLQPDGSWTESAWLRLGTWGPALTAIIGEEIWRWRLRQGG